MHVDVVSCALQLPEEEYKYTENEQAKYSRLVTVNELLMVLGNHQKKSVSREYALETSLT